MEHVPTRARKSVFRTVSVRCTCNPILNHVIKSVFIDVEHSSVGDAIGYVKLHVGSVTINSQKQQKSIKNILGSNINPNTS